MTLKIRNVNKKDEGLYHCVITFANKTVRSTAQLSVFNRQPEVSISYKRQYVQEVVVLPLTDEELRNVSIKRIILYLCHFCVSVLFSHRLEMNYLSSYFQ